MASKITALTALTSVQTDDVLPVVDVHDTTQASSGTTKQITVANLQTGLLKASNNLSDVAAAATARTNLGLGNSATASFETTAGNIKPIGTAAATGSSGKPPNSDHVHAWGQAAPASFTPADPTATASATLVMMGLGATCTYTPAGSGLVLVVVTGGASTNTATSIGTLGGRFGTGTAPANGVAVTGTRFGSAADIQFKSNGVPLTVQTFALTAVLSLTPSTAYWFDIALLTGTGADTAVVKGMSMSFVELP